MKWFLLTLSWRRPLSYRNQCIDLGSKSMDWFLCDKGLRHERANKNHFTVTGRTTGHPSWASRFLSKQEFWDLNNSYIIQSCLPKWVFVFLTFSWRRSRTIFQKMQYSFQNCCFLLPLFTFSKSNFYHHFYYCCYFCCCYCSIWQQMKLEKENGFSFGLLAGFSFSKYFIYLFLTFF